MRRSIRRDMKDVALARWNRCPMCMQETEQRLSAWEEGKGWAEYTCVDCANRIRTFSPPRVRTPVGALKG